jgi:hypothetical protein
MECIFMLRAKVKSDKERVRVTYLVKWECETLCSTRGGGADRLRRPSFFNRAAGGKRVCPLPAWG